jgi:hypothetical protein
MSIALVIFLFYATERTFRGPSLSGPAAAAPQLQQQFSRAASAAGALRAAGPPSSDSLAALGSLSNPCTEPSPYYKARLKELREMGMKGDDTAARCDLCLKDGSPSHTCESQYGQDLFLWTNFFRCMDKPGSYL